ncbi:TIGR01777 family oxidoreductase [Pinibacter soli]|uniref:TIGR01777 family oxidoreductase n=1 Tax=Pinibacter soli TaxID=3044211 RepID=A0ABT6R8Q2_9BACT|nr:TIGR01777 family oxidoreductase [Pinibacter soli]MDI3318938.1 TIGR01777 family oxidoreductase [Pinibacter soli]
MKNRKIIVAVGTGFIGQRLAKYFCENNQIVILTRQLPDPQNNAYQSSLIYHPNIEYVKWDGKNLGTWALSFMNADVVINLAGKSVNCRYNKKNKKEIFDSRTDATKAIGEAIRTIHNSPTLWINAASATIYRHAEDRPQDEYTGEHHNDFSVQVCKLWEKTFYEEKTPQTRKVALRMAITLGDGGVMIPYFNLLKFGLGGRQGNGNQMYSWVHIEDVCRSIDWICNHPEMNGTYNISSPFPVRNNEFMQTLRKVSGHVIGLPAFKWMLRIGAKLIGTETELILKSRWVVPAKMLESGFEFKYAELKPALENIVQSVPRKMYHWF